MWPAPERLAAEAHARLGRVGHRLGAADVQLLAADIDAMTGHLSDRRQGFVHGDLVPVNMLVRDGRLAALLDFEFADSPTRSSTPHGSTRS